MRKTLIEGVSPTMRALVYGHQLISGEKLAVVEREVAVEDMGAIPEALNEDADTLPLDVFETLEERAAR